MIKRVLISICVLIAFTAIPPVADAKPRPGTSGGGHRISKSRKSAKARPRTRARRVVRRSKRSFSRHGLYLAFTAEAPIHPELASFGISAEYQLRFTSALALTVGTDLRFHDRYMFTQPQVGLDLRVGRLSNVAFHTGGGLAVPVRIARDHTAVAIAARGFGGVRWHWSMASRIQPELQVAFLVGPMLTPHHTGHSVYASLQLLVGMRFSI